MLDPHDNLLINFPKLVKTNTRRINPSFAGRCSFCGVKFRNKEKRYCYREPWEKLARVKESVNFHQTCYGVYLRITALHLFTEINTYGRNHYSKRRRTTSKS